MIARTPGKGEPNRLIIPGIAEADNQRELALLYEEAGFPVHPWIRTKTKISARRGKGFFNSDQVIETPEMIDLWEPRWQAGFACSWRTGFVALDVDEPDVFSAWDIGSGIPDTVTVASGREGGFHLYIDFRYLRASVSAEEWPVQGDIPGGTLKTAGFVGAPGSVHPNGRVYRVISGRTVARGSLELLRALASRPGTRNRREGFSGAPGYLDELWRQALAAGNGQQYPAIRNLINGLQKEMSEEAINSVAFPVLLERIHNYKRDPWDTNSLRGLLDPDKTFTSHEEARELDAIRDGDPNVAGEEGEEAFWSAREDLSVIRQWAQAQMVSPWALLGEILAEVIARVPPTFVLPRIVAGYGTLNMLLAITGDAAAGKGGAASVAEDALSIDEPEVNMMKPDRTPIGSGEGLAKNYGYRASGELVRSAYTSIPTCYEVDTLTAMFDRGSATLSPELRKFYSGETIGHGYGDPNKRIVIPKYGYRGIFIVGVQPEQSAAIVRDYSSGLSQRWMFLDAVDHWAPETIPLRPEPVKWALPRSLYELDHDAGKPIQVMKVCYAAADEIIEARKLAVKGKGDSQRGHSLYTQEKFAAGLALLGMRTELTEEDWRLARYAMRRSDEIRKSCEAALLKRRYAAAREEGKIIGVKEVSAAEMKVREEDRKFWKLILKHIPAKGKISRGALGKKMPARRTELHSALRKMVNAKILAVETGEYKGNPAEWYSRIKKG